MKLKHYLSLTLALILIVTLFTGCGGASKQAVYDAAMPMGEMAAAEAPAAMAGNGMTLTESGSAASTALPESRKWIITVHMSAETEDLDTLISSLDEKIRQLGGYTEDQSIHNGSAYANRRYRRASLTIRVPAEDVDAFTDEVAGIANVVNKEKNLEDVTLNYVATESRVTALEIEEARLLELLAKAETMADLLEIEARLTDVRYELENHASRLRLYDNQIDYATIHLSIEEVQEYTPVEEPTLWERIRGGFADSLEALGDSVQDLLVMAVVSLPFLLVYGGILLVLVLLIRKLRKGVRFRKKSKKQSGQEQSQ